MRILIMTDMEGVSGIVAWDQVNGGAPMYEEGRRLYTEEINAAVRGALAAGAQEIVVVDCHGAGKDWTFNSFLESNPLVYLKFGDDDVSELVPDFVDVDSLYDYETASFELGFDWLFSRLRTHHGDIRVRFQGEHGRNDFTIEGGVLDMLREGFWNTCVP